MIRRLLGMLLRPLFWVSSGYADRRALADPSYCPTCKGSCRYEGPMDEEG